MQSLNLEVILHTLFSGQTIFCRPFSIEGIEIGIGSENENENGNGNKNGNGDEN